MLPGLVQALHAQTHAVGRIVGVDTGSRDRSGAVLAELIGQDAVFGMDRAAGFGQAVWGALRRAPARRLDDSGQQQVEWVWLLHDDCEPAPNALDRLLQAASRDRSVVVLGPKVLDGSDRRVLREAGISIDRSGRRVTGIDPAEIDQGQHDHNRAVLAVGSAGMLIRRDAWDQLGGFDTRLRLFRDDVDFCWRAQAAGYRVQVVTDAILYHRELTARKGRVPEGAAARRLDRRNALYVLAVNLPLLTMLITLAGCVAGTLVSAMYYLLTKQLDQAADQMSALSSIFLHPLQLWKARRRRAPGRRQGYNAVRIFIPRARPLRQLSEHFMNLLSPQVAGGQHHASATGAGDEQDELFIEPPSLARRVMASRGVQLFAVLLVIALIAERRLLAASPLGGGALVPAWGGASALWGEYLAGFHAVGVGSAASAPPYIAVVAALATVLGGQAWLAVDVLLLGCVPLAGLMAYLATRRLVVSSAARTWLAAAYALLPVASGAVAAGRLGTTTAFIIAPLIARSAGRMLTAPPRAARSAAWATGLLVAIAAAFVPIVWVVAAGLVLVLLAVRRWVWPVSVVNAAIVVLTPFAVLFPWSVKLVASPSAFLLEAGITPAGLATAGLRPGTLLLLSPGGPGLPPVWVTAGFGLAIVATLLRRRVGLVVAGWSVAIAGFAAALAMSRSTLHAETTGAAVSAWPGTALVIAAIGLLIAAAPAAEWLSTGLSSGLSNGSSGLGKSLAAGRSRVRGPAATAGGGQAAGTPHRAVAILVLAAVASAPILAAWFWMADGVRGPVTTVSSPVLPAFVAASSAGAAQDRTLVLRENDGVLDYSVVRQGDPTLGEPELAGYSPAEQVLATQVAALTAGGADGGDAGQVLSDFGIRWVLLPSPIDTALVQRLDASVGLVQLSSAPAYDLWQVIGPVARVRVIGPAVGGTVTPLSSQAVGMSAVSAPAGGGTLVLAEPYGGWTATINGRPLAPLPEPVDGWAQGFTLPPGGGQLAISRDNMARDVSLIVEVIAFLAICVLALPGKREDPEAQEAALGALAPARRGARAGRTGAHHGGAQHGGVGRRRAAGGQDGGSRDTGPLVSAGRDAAAQADENNATGVGVLTDQLTIASDSALTSSTSDSAFPDQVPDLPAIAGWDDVIAERDSGGWPFLPPQTPAHGTPVRSQASGADPAAERPTDADSGWPVRAGTGENARWMAAPQTGADAGPATGPDSGAHSGWQTGRRTGENAGWTTDPGTGWDTGADSGRDTGSGFGGDTGADSGRDTGSGFGGDAGADSGRDTGANVGWRTGPEAGSLTGGEMTGGEMAGGQAAGGTTVGQPWEPMVAAPDEPVEERRPAERHTHRGGRHGRPARRPWDRLGKDKDGESR
jgi:GT2 family glycosyltransferase